MTRHPDTRGASPCRRRRAGFTIIEVLMVTVLVGVGLVGVSWLMTMAAQTQAVHAANSSDTLVVAREIRELTANLVRTPSGSGPVTDFADIEALDSLDGASFNPPIQADGAEFTAYAGWTQRVDLSLRDLDDTSIVVDSGVPAVDPGAAAIFLLEVDILDGGTVLDTHQWWIKP